MVKSTHLFPFVRPLSATLIANLRHICSDKRIHKNLHRPPRLKKSESHQKTEFLFHMAPLQSFRFSSTKRQVGDCRIQNNTRTHLHQKERLGLMEEQLPWDDLQMEKRKDGTVMALFNPQTQKIQRIKSRLMIVKRMAIQGNRLFRCSLTEYSLSYFI